MNVREIARRFGRLGVEVKFGDRLTARNTGSSPCFLLESAVALADEYDVLDVQPRQRHLILVDRSASTTASYLCGHDERHWFLARVPAGIVRVADAFEMLKPPTVRLAQASERLNRRQRQRRRNPAFLRQGEWFFIPQPQLRDWEPPIFRNERIRRAGSKAHIVSELARQGGEAVLVRDKEILTRRQYKKKYGNLPPEPLGFTRMQRGASVYARGTVRHPDHETLELPGWHLVELSREVSTAHAPNFAFLD